MSDPSEELPSEESEGRSEPFDFGSLNVEAGLAAAFGPLAGGDPQREESLSDDYPGAMIAQKFRLVERIGEGGMGTVWYAEQTTPIKRKVALKLIKPGLDSRRVLARFEAERQALAMMDHPNIAKVFDGGMTDQGRPFFVMELVKGTTLTAFCDERRLGLNDRIELFVSVCQAIHHAHQKGVIHRDIKPSNIMVGLFDGRPVPKVIDFGVAKAIGPSLTDVSVHTEFGAVVGTAEYMSPEQAELNNLDIDTRSDIYSLGVLLYELLTGTPPFPRAQLNVKGLHEVLRVIREDDPERPSVKLSTSKMRASIAASRGIAPDTLGKMLRGDLDWIVMKALEKDRSRRYESAHAMARDLERRLRDEPVEACPPSVRYRTRKFLRRYRWQAAAVGLLLTTLLAGVVGTSLGLLRAQSQRRVALRAQEDALRQKQIAQRAEDATLESYRASTDDAIEKLIISKAALSQQERQYLEGALKRWQAFADRQGDDVRSRAIRAEAHFRVATIWDKLGELDRAKEGFNRAAEHWGRLGADVPEIGRYRNESSRSRRAQARVLRRLNKLPEAETLLRSAIERQEKLSHQFPTIPEYRQELIRESEELGLLLGHLGKKEEALAVLSKVVEAQNALVNEYPEVDEFRLALADCQLNHAMRLQSLGSLGAEAELRLVLENYDRLATKAPSILPYRSGLATCLRQLGEQLVNMGKYAEATQVMRRSIEHLQALVADFPSAPEFREGLADSHQTLGWLLRDYHVSMTLEAEGEYRTVIAIRERLVADFPGVASYRRGLSAGYFNLGTILAAQDKASDARAEFLKALVHREELASSFPSIPDHQFDLWWILFQLGKLDLSTGNAEESKVWFDRAIELARVVLDSQRHTMDARTLLQCAYPGRAKARKLLNDEGFQQDWDQLFALTPDDGHPFTRRIRALIMAEAEQFERLVLELEALALLDSSTGGTYTWNYADWYEFACMFLKASRNLPDRQRELADRGIQMLKNAVRVGYQDVDYMKRDQAIESIRDRFEFKQIIEELERNQMSQK